MVIFQNLFILYRAGDAALPSEFTMSPLEIFQVNGVWWLRPRSSAQNCMYNYTEFLK